MNSWDFALGGLFFIAIGLLTRGAMRVMPGDFQEPAPLLGVVPPPPEEIEAGEGL